MNIIPAQYTEVLVNLLNDDLAKAKIDKALSTYPLYQPKSTNEYIPRIVPTREEINNAILNYYKYREIGFETFGRFLHELETTMNEIMPYYNQLFYTQDLDFNVIYNVDYVREIKREREDNTLDNLTGTTTTETDSSSNSSTTTSNSINSYNKNISSQTPQGNLSITAQNINNVTYADNVTWNSDNTSESGSSTGISSTSADGTTNNTQETTGKRNEDESTRETTKGNYGVVSAQDLIKKYREIIVNDIQEIVNDPRVAELFMLVY